MVKIYCLKSWELWNTEKISGWFLMCVGFLAKNMEMDIVLSFCSTITNFTPDGIEWVEGVSDQRKSVILFFQCESFMSLSLLTFSKTKSSISEYLILGQNHSALSQSPAITSSLDHDASALYKIIISTFLEKFIQTNIWTAARAKYSQALSKTRELCKSLKLQRHSEFEVLHPTACWCIPAC